MELYIIGIYLYIIHNFLICVRLLFDLAVDLEELGGLLLRY